MYGDTDSLFVLLPGRSKNEAFDIGEEMAKAVTQQNPKPVKQGPQIIKTGPQEQ